MREFQKKLLEERDKIMTLRFTDKKVGMSCTGTIKTFKKNLKPLSKHTS